MRMDKGKPFMHVEADTGDAPTFSEGFLYDAVGKGDARFILGVAEEYEHVIDALGPKAVRSILDVKPKLVQRLGIGETVCKDLEDANSWEFENREKELPSQVILDENGASSVWKILHDEYARFFNPEEAMDDERLRTYHYLTDQLGSWEKGQRKKEQDKLPEKLERQKAQKAKLAKLPRRSEARKAIQEKLGGRTKARKLFDEMFS